MNKKRRNVKKGKKINIISLVILLLLTFYVYYNDSDGLNTSISGNKNISDETVKELEDVISLDNKKLSVYFLDVGQADSILIKSDDEYMLIDAGNNEDGEKLVKYLSNLGIEKFKYVVGTHAHEDHIGGMDDIIDNFDIETFYMPDVITTTKTFESVLDSLEKRNIYFDTPKVGEILKLGNSSIEVMSVGDDEKDLNDTSIVLKLINNNICFLFMGDATSNVEKTILDKDIKCDVLKVGHHGSRYSTSNDFLNKVSPSYAVISAGKNNSYNHPHSELLDRLNNLKINIYRTDELGTIIFSSDGEKMEINNVKTDLDGN